MLLIECPPFPTLIGILWFGFMMQFFQISPRLTSSPLAYSGNEIESILFGDHGAPM